MPTYRTLLVDAVHNNEELRLILDLLEERHERTTICEANVKSKMRKYYNARVRGVTFRPGDFFYRSNDASHAVDGGKLGPNLCFYLFYEIIHGDYQELDLPWAFWERASDVNPLFVEWPRGRDGSQRLLRIPWHWMVYLAIFTFAYHLPLCFYLFYEIIHGDYQELDLPWAFWERASDVNPLFVEWPRGRDGSQRLLRIPWHWMVYLAIFTFAYHLPPAISASYSASLLEALKRITEEHYEDILPVIMDKICHDKRKEVHARLDFKENPKKTRRVREDSQNSGARTLRYRNPSERPKMWDRIKYNDEDVFDRLGHRRLSTFDRLSHTYSPTKTGPNEGNSRDHSHINNLELTKRFNERVPKTVEEMMTATTAFLQEETIAASKKKVYTPWKLQDQSKRHTSEQISDFQNQPKDGRGSNKFTPLTIMPKEIFTTESGKFKPPPYLGQILADFLVEKPDDALPKASVIETPQEPRIIFMDGSSCVDGSEYEALIAGLRIAAQILIMYPRYIPSAALNLCFHVTLDDQLVHIYLQVLTDLFVKGFIYQSLAHCMMIKSSKDNTPFSLTYETEAVISVEIRMPTYRTLLVDAVHNNEELRLILDLLEERHERVAICEANVKSKMRKYYNARVRGVTFRPGDFFYRSNDASHAVDGGKLGPK
nr:reverse transcriptase domain-containing protein [Tanacetum cinerariifolium]